MATAYMKHLHFLKTTLLTLVLTAALAAGPGLISRAANEDPGYGRLSETNISAEFYDTEDSSLSLFNKFSFNRLGSSITANTYTGKNYTHADAFDGRTIVNGIDVSVYQANIDWTKVKAAGIDFAFVRVGYRGYESGSLTYPYYDANGAYKTGTKDTYFDKNMQGAAAAGVSTGIYIFSQAITTAEAVEEAQYILNNIGSYNVSMPLIMDYEYAGTTDGGRLKKAKLSKAKATEICMAFCDTIAQAGYTPMVYANKSMLENQLNPADLTAKGYRIWLANYTTNTSYAGTYDFWQYSSAGKVDGISGNVDMNFYYKQDGDNFIHDSSNISSATVNAIPDQQYTGTAILPALNVTWQGQPLVLNQDYTVAYSNNTNVGKATVKIAGIGQYKGAISVNFNIIPTTVTGLKAKKRTTSYITLSWSKNTSGSGYEIYRSTAQNGSYEKIATISKNSTTSFKNTNRNAGQRYYYQVRSYKKVGNTTYYGPFSSIKPIDTKTGYTRNALAKSEAIIYDTTSIAGNVIAAPAKDTSMSVSFLTKDEAGSSWYYVSCKINGVTHNGYIPAGKVTITKVGKVTKTNVVNVRKSNSTKSKILTTLKKNKTVTVLSTKKKKGVTWYKVTFKKSGKTYTGWISAPFIKLQ